MQNNTPGFIFPAVGDVYKADDTWQVCGIYNGHISLCRNFNLRAENKIALKDVNPMSAEFVVTQIDTHYSPGDHAQPPSTYYTVNIKQLDGRNTFDPDAQECSFVLGDDPYTKTPLPFSMEDVTPIRHIHPYFVPARDFLQPGDVVRADDNWQIAEQQPGREEYILLNQRFNGVATSGITGTEMVVTHIFSTIGGDCPKENEMHEVYLRPLRADGAYDRADTVYKIIQAGRGDAENIIHDVTPHRRVSLAFKA